MAKFKIGNKVRVRKDLEEGHKYKIYVHKEMEKYKGQIMTIKDVEGSCYILKEAKREYSSLEWRWTDDMLENANLVKSIDDLQFGDVLTLRNGERYVFDGRYMYGENEDCYCDGQEAEEIYGGNLIYDSNNEFYRKYDIAKIEREGQLIYEREEVREMTTEEISEALGYKVKVV